MHGAGLGPNHCRVSNYKPLEENEYLGAIVFDMQTLSTTMTQILTKWEEVIHMEFNSSTVMGITRTPAHIYVCR